MGSVYEEQQGVDPVSALVSLLILSERLSVPDVFAGARSPLGGRPMIKIRRLPPGVLPTARRSRVNPIELDSSVLVLEDQAIPLEPAPLEGRTTLSAPHNRPVLENPLPHQEEVVAIAVVILPVRPDAVQLSHPPLTVFPGRGERNRRSDRTPKEPGSPVSPNS
ncbi:MAG: hypothetical protein ACM3UP_00205 [Methanocella sp.]